MGSLGTGELVIVLIIILLVFGGAKLPKLARSLGQAQKEFKDGLADGGARHGVSGLHVEDVLATSAARGGRV